MAKMMLMVIVLAGVAVSLSACNTVKGMGTDLTKASDAVQKKM